MNITQRLLDLNPDFELHNEGKWNEKIDSESFGFTSFNDAGVETETGEFLYAMVRILKPGRVLETGTHWGVGTAYMATALKDNKSGTIDTIEFLPEIFNKAKKNIENLGLQQQVMQYCMDVKDFKPVDFGLGKDVYDLILLDTEPQTRFAELVKFYPFLKDGGFVFIHDLHRHMHQIPNEEHGFAWPYGPIPEEIKSLVREDKLRPFHFPTPRGLTGFYKPSAGDYKWV